MYLSVTVAYSVFQSGPLCNVNEVYESRGSPCEKSCDTLDGNFGCAQVATTGCFCRQGFVRSSNRFCIPVSACFQQKFFWKWLKFPSINAWWKLS